MCTVADKKVPVSFACNGVLYAFRWRFVSVSYFSCRKAATAKREYKHGQTYNEYTQLRILQLNGQRFCPPSITKYLAAEGIKVSRKGVAKFIKKFYVTGRLHICNDT